jgi:putative FmdB family regulatory protein
MPLYEYQCEACATRVEKIQKFSDPPLATCEACGGALRKLPSSPAIQFKGSGWYITDYAKKTAVEGTTTSKPADTAAGDARKADGPKSDTSDSPGAGTSGTSGTAAASSEGSKS